MRWAAQYWKPTIGPPSINAQRLAGAVASVPGQAERYGFGILEVPTSPVGRVLFHSGGWGGFVTTFAVLPDQRLAVAATCTSAESVPGQKDPTGDLLTAWAK